MVPDKDWKAGAVLQKLDLLRLPAARNNCAFDFGKANCIFMKKNEKDSAIPSISKSASWNRGISGAGKPCLSTRVPGLFRAQGRQRGHQCAGPNPDLFH